MSAQNKFGRNQKIGVGALAGTFVWAFVALFFDQGVAAAGLLGAVVPGVVGVLSYNGRKAVEK